MAVAESLLVGVFVVSVIKLYQYLKWRLRVNKMLEKMDGPKGLPIIGVVWDILKSESVLDYFSSGLNKYSSPAKVWLGPAILYLQVDDPKNVKIILNSDETLDKANFYQFFRLDNTIFANKKHKWKFQRKALNTMRNKNFITAYNPIVTSRSEKLAESMSRHVDGPEFDVFNYIGAYIVESVFKATFDLDYDALGEPDENEVIHKIEMSNATYCKRMQTIPYHLYPIYRLSKLYQDEKMYNLESFYERLMYKKVQDLSDPAEQARLGYELVIKVFLKPENNFKPIETRDSLKGLVFAAFDTTSSSLSSILVMLGMHPEIQEKLFKEVSETINSSDGVLDFNVIKKMNYLDLVCKESLRLFPPAPLLGRSATEDLKLNEDQTIPAGTNILINVFKMHRDPKYWGDDAHLFIPERFEPDRIKNVDPNAYIPFSLGPRNCIGYFYAQLLLKTALTHIVKNFHISTSMKFEEIKIDVNITMKFQQGYNISIKKRLQD